MEAENERGGNWGLGNLGGREATLREGDDGVAR